MIIEIVYDNEARSGLQSDWGFAALIRKDENILFDTGTKVSILRNNMEKMGIGIDEIDKVVLSHEHHDHVGGLDCVLSEDLEVFVPVEFSSKIKNKIERTALLNSVSGPQRISKGIYTTGGLKGHAVEQSLVIELMQGVAVVTGCAHPGLVRILEASKGYGDIRAVIGGFHGFDEYEALEDVEKIVPCHCTKNKIKIKRRFEEKTIDCFAGLKIEME